MVLMITTACVEEYDPQVDKYEQLVVVDGMITNDEGPYQVKLSYSSDLQEPRVIPLTDAEVIIRDSEGHTEYLTEMEEGIYHTDPNGIQGKTGNLYQLEIQTSDGAIYLSSFENLPEPVDVDRIYSEVEFQSSEEIYHDIVGLRFFLDTKRANSNETFLMWSLYATFEYQTEFKIRYYFEGMLKPFPNPDSLMTCWLTKRIPEIFTSRMDVLNEPLIRHFPLHYVNTESRDLYIRYSLLVSQYTMEKESWSFWDRVREQNEEQGSLFSQQPFQIIGNIRCLSNPDEPVLGQFTAAGISKSRIFIERPNLPFYFFKCELSEGDYESMSTIDLYPPDSWPVYVTTGPEGGMALPLQACMDCRLRGGTIEKPAFWTSY
ncbi:MAG: DUF4249 domain-containing protein [Bacteroidetes bacterium]|nr:DUF4249 domain-containing protein [Bacteroidota bacterium]